MSITEWGDFSNGKMLSHSANVKEVRPIGTEWIFLRFTAAPKSSTTLVVEWKPCGGVG